MKKRIPTWAIVVGFMFGFWPGMLLLAFRLFQDSEEKNSSAARRTTREWEGQGQNASRTYNTQGQRTYQPPKATGETEADYARRMAEKHRQAAAEDKTAQPVYGQKADGTYRYSYTKPAEPVKKEAPRTTVTGRPVNAAGRAESTASAAKKPQAPRSLLDHRLLNPKKGKGLRLAGHICLGVGAFITALTFLGMLVSGRWIGDIIGVTSIVALCCCTPGLVFSVIGGKNHNRVMRCRTYAAMIGNRRSVDIKELASAIPTRYSKCVKDLQWMLSEGLLKGMYIDRGDKTLTFGDSEPVKPAAATAAAPVQQTASGVRVYAEETRIRNLNNMIADAYVSERMDRLEELTHKILAYAEAHPEKEANLRQFRNHYLPKTFSILESYARMEQMGVEGGNISSAMKDVEDIMDKLVLGFEKQLDALFDSEALDVTTDVSVLENMMNLEGLSDLDPFGAMTNRSRNETWEKN